MIGAGAPTSQPFDAGDLKVAVVAASWHTQVMDGLVGGAERALAAYGVKDPDVNPVDGTIASVSVVRDGTTNTVTITPGSCQSGESAG